MSKSSKKKRVRKNSNYNHHLIKTFPVDEVFHVNPMWDEWQLGFIIDKRSFYNALKNGEYIVGFDTSPHGGVIYQNVFHYHNGYIEIYKFVPNALASIPCKLHKDVRIRISKDVFEAVGDVIIRNRYKGFLVSHNGVFLDVKDVLGEHQESIRIMQPTQFISA